MTHSILAPSSAPIWGHCAGYVLMDSMYPEEEETPETKEGTAVHWVGAEGLKLQSVTHLLGATAPNGVVITQEMLDCVQVYLDDVKSLVTLRPHIEEKLHIPKIHQECFGTPDVWCYNMYDHVVYLWDYKHGHGEVPVMNYQMVCYLAGIMTALDLDDQIIKAVVTIVQPRCFSDEGPVRRETIMLSDLRGVINTLEAKALEALAPDAQVVSGNHCRYCPARLHCKAARHAAHNAIDYAFSALPNDMDGDALSFEVALLQRGLKAIEYRLESVQAKAISVIHNQGRVPGFGIKMGSGNRKFDGDIKTIIDAGKKLGVNMLQDPKLITPAEFDKQTKGKDVTEVAKYITKSVTGLKLVPATETAAIKAFKPGV